MKATGTSGYYFTNTMIAVLMLECIFCYWPKIAYEKVKQKCQR